MGTSIKKSCVSVSYSFDIMECNCRGHFFNVLYFLVLLQLVIAFSNDLEHRVLSRISLTQDVMHVCSQKESEENTGQS